MQGNRLPRRMAWVALAAALLLAGGTLALAEDYPNQPLNMVVTSPAGGATDFQARMVTVPAGKDQYLGQPIVIINKPGGGGRVGWEWLVHDGSRDGYTLAVYNVPHFIAQSIVYNIDYSTDTFEPVANWGADPAVLITPKNGPFNNVQELVAFAKRHPGQLTVAGGGMYVSHHIAALQFMKAAGIELAYMPDLGGVTAMESVIMGKVMAGFNNLSDSYRNQGRIKILAVADLERHEFLPQVPTFKEEGYDVDDSSKNYRGVVLPKGVPPAVIAKLAAVFPRMFNDKKVQAKMKASGSPMKVLTRDQVIKMFQERRAYLEVLLAEHWRE